MTAVLDTPTPHRRPPAQFLTFSASTSRTGWLGKGRFHCEPFDDETGRGDRVRVDGDYADLFTLCDFQTRLTRLRAMAFTRSPARPVRRQNRRARSIAPRWEK
jgi:hypothetical protein